ncbi:MAG: type VI secretion system baseplate subunit TssG [Holosporaceae bacterium]|jgi:predicted component of type VI protein secretion system|nr:type VI secretion system baseplate subunit TssG [Holosporaceae bacterium]
MGNSIRDQKLPLIQYLEKYPQQFSFEMAAYILEHGAQTSFGKEINLYDSTFRTGSINSFHLRRTEIEKISEIDGVKIIYVERLSLSGLNAPLPTPYGELILRNNQEKNFAMPEFVNTFNMRILGISYQISRRRYLSLQRHSGTNCMLTRAIATFSGESPSLMDKRMARLSYLFWTKEKSAAGLKAIIEASLGFSTQIEEFRTFWTHRKKIDHLGNMTLGKTSELGKSVSLSSFGVEIALTHENYHRIFQLLCDEEPRQKLKLLVRKYLGEFFYCVLKLTPKSVPSLKIGTTSSGQDKKIAILGRTSWMPARKLDSAAMIL